VIERGCCGALRAERPDGGDDDAVGAGVAVAGRGDDAEHGWFADLFGIDLIGELEESGGGPLDGLFATELDFEGSPAAVAGLDDDVDLEPIAVAVVVYGRVEGYGVDAAVPDGERLEEEPEVVQVAQESVRAGGDSGRCE